MPGQARHSREPLNNSKAPQSLERINVFRLGAFLALGNLHGHLLPFVKRSSSSTIDGAEVNKYIFTAFLFDETKTLFIVEPFNGTFNYL